MCFLGLMDNIIIAMFFKQFQVVLIQSRVGCFPLFQIYSLILHFWLDYPCSVSSFSFFNWTNFIFYFFKKRWRFIIRYEPISMVPVWIISLFALCPLWLNHIICILKCYHVLKILSESLPSLEIIQFPTFIIKNYFLKSQIWRWFIEV